MMLLYFPNSSNFLNKYMGTDRFGSLFLIIIYFLLLRITCWAPPGIVLNINAISFFALIQILKDYC
jgi:hypothetical protein